MLTAEARVTTSRASRYLVQLCKHADAMGTAQGHGHLRSMLARREVRVHADWSDTYGTITFNPWGQCTITADANTLTLRIQAATDEELGRIQDIITRDLKRFGRRDQLNLVW
jgi:hypothetical protein